jgi:hypothetical protein
MTILDLWLKIFVYKFQVITRWVGELFPETHNVISSGNLMYGTGPYGLQAAAGRNNSFPASKWGSLQSFSLYKQEQIINPR